MSKPKRCKVGYLKTVAVEVLVKQHGDEHYDISTDDGRHWTTIHKSMIQNIRPI